MDASCNYAVVVWSDMMQTTQLVNTTILYLPLENIELLLVVWDLLHYKKPLILYGFTHTHIYIYIYIYMYIYILYTGEPYGKQ